MITFQVESYSQVAEDIKPLLEEHWREVALYQDEIKLEPDWQRYEKLSAAGLLVIVTGRKDKVLIGYSIFTLAPNAHYKSVLMASNDVLFVSGKERKTGAGLKLIRRSEDVLRKLGAKRILWHVKPAHDFSSILERLGYVKEDFTMGKLLGD